MKAKFAAAIIASSVALVPALSFAAPSLVLTPQMDKAGRLNIKSEFIADSANPVAALIFEVKMNRGAAAYSKAAVNIDNCVSGLPAGFSGLCNPGTTDGSVRVVIYSSNPKAQLPSGVIGHMTVPGSAVKLARQGEVELGFVEFTSPEAKVIKGNTLVDVEPKLGKPGLDRLDRELNGAQK